MENNIKNKQTDKQQQNNQNNQKNLTYFSAHQSQYYAVMLKKMVDIIKYLQILLKQFPREEKYALSTQIRNKAIDVYNLIVEGNVRFNNKTTLTSLNVAVENLKMLLSLAYELGYFRCKNETKNIRSAADAERRFIFVSENLKEIGKMLGGWIKKVYGDKEQKEQQLLI